MSRRLSKWFLMPLLLVLPACSARVKTSVARAPDTGLRNYQEAFVSVEANTTGDASRQAAQLESEVIARLRTGGIFRAVQPWNGSGGPGAVHVKIAVTNAKKVGTAKRMLLGAFAGRARVTTRVELLDASTGRQLGAYDVKGESGGMGFSGGTDDAVGKAAQGIVDSVRSALR